MSGSTGKTLSNGTLSLRFMQNAQRAKQQASVDLERAKVKDDAEWEVSREVRDAWGIPPSSKPATKQSISHETSYLPFLFPSLRKSTSSADDESMPEASTSSTKISGRRTFNKGKEVVASTTLEDDTEDPPNNLDASAPSRRKERPVMRGGLLTARRGTRVAEELNTKTHTVERLTAPGAPVLTMISEEKASVVGWDLRKMRKMREKDAAVEALAESAVNAGEQPGATAKPTRVSGAPSFLRPAGVDSPAANATGGAKKIKKRNREEGDTGGAESTGKVSTAEPVVDAGGQRQVKKKKKQRKQAETSGTSASTS
ncbi:hypothetical protein DFH11DRAFT_1726311 [Phellopilus nigrolimitatus]|nr:hypothetical protein DFH11DRAFT_1726311 [Phellopilus nigrolimitatus]